MRKSFRKALAGAAVVAVLSGGVATAAHVLSAPQPAISVVHLDYPADFRDTRYLAGAVENVFVGRVVRQASAVALGRTPETQFSVVVEQTLKGSASGEVVVNQMGGYDAVSKSTVLAAGDALLVPGATYVFATRTHPNGSWQTLVNVFGDVRVTEANRLTVVARFTEGIAHQIAPH